MIATNGAGMRAIKYGKMENRVEKLEILTVSSQGEIQIQTLSQTEAKDFFGAEGRLGIVVSATLKIIELPTKKSLIFKTFEKFSEVLAEGEKRKKEKKSDLSAMELISPQVATLLGREKKYVLIIEFENDIDGEITDPEQIQQIRSKRDACYAVCVNAGFPQIEDPELHDHEMEFLQRCEDHEILVYGHIGIGVLHPHFNDSQKDLMHEMYQLVQNL
ncbi:FAD-binding oxidoreductase [bacterium]|nr:FAD-binding oxidoreductase [bacterium]